MKNILSILLSALSIISLIALCIFLEINVEMNNFDVLPKYFIILLVCLAVIILIARHNTKIKNKENNRERRRVKNMHFKNEMHKVNEEGKKIDEAKRNKEASLMFKFLGSIDNNSSKNDDYIKELCERATRNYFEKISH